jgi:hypothetical protein
VQDRVRSFLNEEKLALFKKLLHMKRLTQGMRRLECSGPRCLEWRHGTDRL